MITIVQHGEDEGPGTIRDCLAGRQIPFVTCRLYAGDPLPDILPESLIVLGGQMSVNDTHEYPCFVAEKALVRTMVLEERPVLGICLGAQMIASAFGQEVCKGSREIGWQTVHGLTRAMGGIFAGTFPVFHWHEETFNLPVGATPLVEGETVKNQAFRLGSAIGVQFHPEVNEEIIAAWSKALPARQREEFARETQIQLEGNRQRCHALIDAFSRGWVL